jgi:hypothetical protein
VAILCLSAAYLLNLCVVSTTSGGSAYFRGNEAYFLLSRTEIGTTSRCLTVVAQFFEVFLFPLATTPIEPQYRIDSYEMLHYKAGTLERRIVVMQNSGAEMPSRITPAEDGLYAHCPGKDLCKWDGGQWRTTSTVEFAL